MISNAMVFEMCCVGVGIAKALAATKAAPRAGLEQTQIDHSYDAQENIKPIPAQLLVHDV